jgi:hypothetical protein
MGLIEKLKAGKSNIRIMKFPGTDEDIGITVLTEGETQEAMFAAERLYKDSKIEVSGVTVGSYTSEQNTQILSRALVDPGRKKADGSYERYFKSVGELRGLLRREAKETLIEEYNRFEEETSPSPLKISAEELDILLEDIKKNPETVGNVSSFCMLRELTLYLVNQLVILQKGNGSTSSE